MTSADRHTSILDIDLPEIPDRNPFTPPSSHLVKKGPNQWGIAEGRRPSKTLLVNRIRRAVDQWRADGYPGATETTRRLFQFWFDEDHALPTGPFRYYFCQREAMETLVYLHQVQGLRDCYELITSFYEEPETGQLELGITARGDRKVRRFVPELGQVVEQDLPREDLPRMAIKMATGSGKTVVMALVIAWSYFHRRFEDGSDLADNFLVVAPNVIVFERLRQDFESGKVFHELPIIPPEWKPEWKLNVILRGDASSPRASGNLFVTNIQQIYDRDESDDEPINPVAALLGPAPKGDIHSSEPMLERIKRLPNLMVLNDEAHHVHDDKLKWNEALLTLDDNLRRRDGGGLVAWLDFSATPKNQNGTFFPWIVVDYPLAQAVEDRIVKTPLIIHQTDRPDPTKYAHGDAGDAYNEWITIGVARWREHVKDYGAVGEKPILFVMAEDTRDADAIAERLEREADLKGRVLTIHVNRSGKNKGEISKADLDKAREAAREIDSGRSRYRAVVSVLMLREGWDVRNVSVILGLRPFTAKANILPEQAIGRGLRLMRRIPRDNTQILELIGTKAFEEFVRELEKEGLGVATSRTPPKPGRRVYPVADRPHLDIEIPRTSALFERAYKNIEVVDPESFKPLADEEELGADLKRKIKLEHGIVGVTVHSDEVEFNEENVPPIENLLSALTNRVIRKARITTNCFQVLYPKVRSYVRDRCFGGRVELDDVAVRRALNDGNLLEAVASVFARRIGELTTEQRSLEVVGEPYRLSETPEFTWRRHFTTADKTIFNVVACYNNFEARFAQFLDRAEDVDRFAELAEWFTGFHVQYLKSSGAIGTYYPDFVVVQTTDDGPVNWIIETKGREDVEVAAKDAQMARWCNEVSAVSGQTWKYMKVPQLIFDRGSFSSLASLVREVERASTVAGAQQLLVGPGGDGDAA
ncbi:MAG: hypothetical protein D6724_09180 [Armatimonadetes bacterium]|nr:MAG: hypothetical protein D6724_09180 [Armatimonadota bacterium]